MELWIRSQDKKSLIIANEITYQQSGSVMYNGLHCEIYNGKTLLGTYETKERALEVLDEIQNILINDNKTILQPRYPVRIEDLESMKNWYQNLNDNSISIYGNEIEVVNSNKSILVYEMPTE